LDGEGLGDLLADVKCFFGAAGLEGGFELGSEVFHQSLRGFGANAFDGFDLLG